MFKISEESVNVILTSLGNWIEQTPNWETHAEEKSKEASSRKIHYHFAVYNSKVWFGLVSLFNGISTFVGYLMRKISPRCIEVLQSVKLRFFFYFGKYYLLVKVYLFWALHRDYFILIFYIWIFKLSYLELFPTRDLLDLSLTIYIYIYIYIYWSVYI